MLEYILNLYFAFTSTILFHSLLLSALPLVYIKQPSSLDSHAECDWESASKLINRIENQKWIVSLERTTVIHTRTRVRMREGCAVMTEWKIVNFAICHNSFMFNIFPCIHQISCLPPSNLVGTIWFCCCCWLRSTQLWNCEINFTLAG